MATYAPTGDENIVTEEVTINTDINMSDLVTTYLSLKDRYLALPNPKTVPDAETLQYYNLEIDSQREVELIEIQNNATTLYLTLTDIRSAGLLPVHYEDEYQTLKTFIEGF